MKTGMSCSMEFMKYVPLAGTWKMICCENIKENLCALGNSNQIRYFSYLFKIMKRAYN